MRSFSNRLAVVALLAPLAVGGCVAPRKINETNWMYELERNSFEKKWGSFFGSLDEPQVAALGKVFTTNTDAALTEFEKTLDHVKLFKFAHMLDSAMLCEDTRRDVAAKLAQPTPPPGAPTPPTRSAFDRMEIIPGAPTHLPEVEASGEEGDCLTPKDAYEQSLAAGFAAKAAHPLPAGRKDIEEICHRLHPFGFARHWGKRASEWCVTPAAFKSP